MNAMGGLWTRIESAYDAYNRLFVYNENDNLTASQLRALIHIEFLDKGSNARPAEEDTVYCWELFLTNCEGKARSCEINILGPLPRLSKG